MNKNDERRLALALTDAESAIRDARARGYTYQHDSFEGYPHCLDEAVLRLGPEGHYPVPRKAIAESAGLLLAALIQHPDQTAVPPQPEKPATVLAERAEERGQGICRTCLAPIWNEGGTAGHIKRDTGWSDRIERGGDSLVCFKAIDYRHVPLEGREAAIYDQALARGAEMGA